MRNATAATSAVVPAPTPRLRRPRPGRADVRIVRGMVSSALFRRYRPVLAFLTVTRRCNLSCGYCNEYDHTSQPVPLAVLRERIDHLARLRTVVVTLNGGEPLLHPELPAIVAYVRERGMVPALNTNGFLLTAERIAALGRAGLYSMQVSVDAVNPNAVTKKALKPLLPKLRLLARHATFRVRVNTVLGSAPPEEALEVARVVLAHGFDAKCALVRNSDGTMAALDARTREIYGEIGRLEGRSLGVFGEGFQDDLLRDGRVDWKCRAGARFFHVCEDGLVHLCGPRFGAPAKPLAEYGELDLRRAFHERKPCAATCPVAYAHMVSRMDRFRPQERAEQAPPPAPPTVPARRHLPVVAS